MRNYNKQISKHGDVYTLSDFIDRVNDGTIGNFDGDGYWCQTLFSSEPEDATHVVWFNK